MRTQTTISGSELLLSVIAIRLAVLVVVGAVPPRHFTVAGQEVVNPPAPVFNWRLSATTALVLMQTGAIKLKVVLAESVTTWLLPVDQVIVLIVA